MNLLKLQIICFFTIAVICIFSCSKTNVPDTSKETILNLPEIPYDYTRQLGSHFQLNFYQSAINYDRSQNKIVELGRVLFYDKNLSVNNTTSCASCHQQQFAFSDNVPFSTGFNGLETNFNSLALFNKIINQEMLWDNSEWSLSSEILSPLSDHVEMGIKDRNYLFEKISLLNYYDDMFSDVGYNEINVSNIRNAIANFVGSIVSNKSKYDLGYTNNFSEFTQQEKFGLSIFFKSGCNSCHNLEFDSEKLIEVFGRDNLFNGYTSQFLGSTGNVIANNGLDLEIRDEGTGNSLFKIPSIRNVELTTPYMHDGRFRTLEEVVEHYNEDMQKHPDLDCRLTPQCNPYEDAIPNIDISEPIKFDFNQSEQEALVAFLKTLTDYELINSPLYSNPFK